MKVVSPMFSRALCPYCQRMQDLYSLDDLDGTSKSFLVQHPSRGTPTEDCRGSHQQAVTMADVKFPQEIKLA